MDTPEKNLSIESIDQAHNPEANRFLNSLGFGESVLRNLQDAGTGNDSCSFDSTQEERTPAIMLSSQADDMALPGADSFSEATPVRRGGLQDIARRQSVENQSMAPASMEPERVSEPLREESFSGKSTAEEPIAEIEVEDREKTAAIEAPDVEATSQPPLSSILSVTVNGREIRKTGDAAPDRIKELNEEVEVDGDSITAEITVLSDDRIEVGKEELAEEEKEFTNTETEEPMTLSCPKCDGELALRKEHLGVEGNCVWCESAIIAAESGVDGTVGVFLIQTEDVADEIPEEVPTIPEEQTNHSVSEPIKEEEPAEFPVLEAKEEDSPGIPLFEKPDDLSPLSTIENKPQIEQEKPSNTEFSSLPDSPGFADLPSARQLDPDNMKTEVSVEKTIGNPDLSTIPVESSWSKLPTAIDEVPELDPGNGQTVDDFTAPPELPSASTFAQLGHEAAWSEPLPDAPEADESALEEFPFLDSKSDPGEAPDSPAETDDSSPETPSFLESVSENQTTSEIAKESLSIEKTEEPATNTDDPSPSPEPFPKPVATSSSPFLNTESNPESAKPGSEGKLKIPDDVLSFLGSIEADDDNDGSPGDPATNETEDDDEIAPNPEETALAEEEIETVEEEVAPLSKRERKKERRAAKKEAAKKDVTGPIVPLPAPGKLSVKSTSKMPGKTKIGLVSIAGLVIGIGVASFFIPVQEYVDKARELMSEAFNKQIGLDPNWQPPAVKENEPDL